MFSRRILRKRCCTFKKRSISSVAALFAGGDALPITHKSGFTNTMIYELQRIVAIPANGNIFRTRPVFLP